MNWTGSQDGASQTMMSLAFSKVVKIHLDSAAPKLRASPNHRELFQFHKSKRTNKQKLKTQTDKHLGYSKPNPNRISNLTDLGITES